MADRLRTNAEIDILNNFLEEGQEKLPYELDENNQPLKLELTAEQLEQKRLQDEQEKEAAKKQKEIDKELEAEKQRVLAQAGENKNNPHSAAPEDDDIDEAKILAYLKNKKGKDISSLDEFINPKKELTEEEKAAAKEKRESEKFAFGLQKGIFSKKEFESFITDSKSPTQLVYAAYHASQKASDVTLTDEDLQSEFDEKFGLTEEKDSRKFKAGQLLLNNIADKIIRDKHSKILNLENDFSSYENQTAAQKEQSEKIQSQTPLYKKEVEQVRSEMKKVSISMDNGENFEYDLPDTTVDDIISTFLDNTFASNQIKKGWNKEELKNVAQTSAIIKNLPAMFRSFADAEILKKQAGTRGIPNGNARAHKLDDSEMTEQQKQAISFAFPNGTEGIVAN